MNLLFLVCYFIQRSTIREVLITLRPANPPPLRAILTWYLQQVLTPPPLNEHTQQ
jgi:hypothetical protein